MSSSPQGSIVSAIDQGTRAVISNQAQASSEVNEAQLMSVYKIGIGLFNQSLPHKEWTHQAHLAAAVYILMLRSDLDASKTMPTLIRRYNTSHGVANTSFSGFHATITEFYLRVIRRFLDDLDSSLDPEDAFRKLLDSPIADRSFPLRFYAKERLFSVAARKQWLEPNKLKFVGKAQYRNCTLNGCSAVRKFPLACKE